MENQDSCISNPALVEKSEEVPVENPDVQTTDMVATTGEITVVDSPIHHHSILSDHQLEVDGVIYRELKTLNRVVSQDGPDAGKDEQTLVHTRSIGDQNYTVTKINIEGSNPSNEETEEISGENNLTSDEVLAFQEAWDKNWNPSLGQQEDGQPEELGIKRFFKKIWLQKFHNFMKE